MRTASGGALGILAWAILGCLAGEGQQTTEPIPAPSPAPPPAAEITAACQDVSQTLPQIDAKISAGDTAGGAQLALELSQRFGPFLDLEPRPAEVQAVTDPLVARLSYFQVWIALQEVQADVAGNRQAEAQAALTTAQEAIGRVTGDFGATPAAQKLRQDLERAQRDLGPQLEQIRQGDEAEARFCRVLKEHATLYQQAPNDLKRSAVRAARAKALREAVPGGRVLRWLGTIKTLTTTSQGNAVLEMTLPCTPFGMGTWNNELSDGRYSTLIPISSPAFEALSNMAPGTPIRFDGTLVPDPDGLDGFGEVSLTEKGSMTAGFFLVRMR